MLDTNICSYIIKNKPLNVREKFEKFEMGACCISSITLAELKFWVAENKRHHEHSRNAGTVKVNEKVIEIFVNHLLVVDFDTAAANCYGEIRSFFRGKGIVISNLDLLIGSHATSLEITLVSNNLKEFNHFPNLHLENWISL